jgi:hypothetical protein
MILGESSDSRDATGLRGISRHPVESLLESIPSAFSAELAGNTVAARGITIPVTLEIPFRIVDLDLSFVKHVDDGANTRASSATVGALDVSNNLACRSNIFHAYQ